MSYLQYVFHCCSDVGKEYYYYFTLLDGWLVVAFVACIYIAVIFVLLFGPVEIKYIMSGGTICASDNELINFEADQREIIFKWNIYR